LHISVAQKEINGDYQVSIWGARLLGTVGAVADAAVTNTRAFEAEGRAGLVRPSLRGFDFDSQARKASQEALAKSDWLGITTTSFGKDSTLASHLERLNRAKTHQVLFNDYAYYLSDDLKEVRVALIVTLAKREVVAGQIGEERMDLKYLIYHQEFTCVIPLAAPASRYWENGELWAADQGRRARSAIEFGVDCVGRMFGMSLAQTRESLAAIQSAGGKVEISGRPGQIINLAKEGTLRFDGVGTWVYQVRDGL